MMIGGHGTDGNRRGGAYRCRGHIWICSNGLDKGSESNRSRETYFGFAIRIAPGPLSQLTAFSPRFPLFLLFYKVVDYNATLLCVDGQDLPPVADDHKIQVRTGGR